MSAIIDTPRRPAAARWTRSWRRGTRLRIEHELYDTEVTLPEGRVNNTKEMYEKTMNDMRIFADKGLNVYCLWEDHQTIARRAKLALWPMCLQL